MADRGVLCALVAAAVLFGGQALAASDAEKKRCASGDPDVSIRACTVLIDRGASESAADRAKALFFRAGSFVARDDAQRALADYERSAALDPNAAPTFNNRGNLYRKIGDLDRALADYDRAIALNPKSLFAYNGRGNVYRDKGDLDRALADFDQALTFDPKSTAALNSRGNVHFEKGDLDRALADYDGAIALDPKLSFAYNGRGNAHKEKGDLGRALADYDRAIALNPNYASALNSRGSLYRTTGHLDRALADFDRAIGLNPKYAVAYNGRGNVYRDKGDLGRALADYEQAIALDSKSSAAFNGRGNVYKERGDLDRALADYDRAISLNPGEAVFLNQRGDAYQAKGDLTRAVADFDRVIALAPAFVERTRAKRDAALKLAAVRNQSSPAADTPPAAPPPPAATARQDATPPATTARRFAFVVGNGKYEKISGLRNTVFDAKSIAEKLTAKGFVVTLRTDISRTEFLLVFDRFREQLRKDDEVVVYYAGHGVEVNGANFLVPVDVPAFSPRAKQLIQDSSLSLTSLLVQISTQGPRATLVILDACRNDPFPEDPADPSNTRSAGPVRDGLGQVSAPEGMMVMYSAGVNQTALDSLGQGDRDPNGLFTRSLLRLMDEKGLEISGMAKRLRAEVQTAAKTVVDDVTGKPHAQTPAVYDQMVGEFFFTPAQ